MLLLHAKYMNNFKLYMKSNERIFDTTARYNSIDRTEVERAALYIYSW